ncbi:MAG TPA: hypothetical protein VGG28_13380 [Kofleriaceae bacterium]
MTTALYFAVCYAGVLAAIFTAVGAITIAAVATRSAYVRAQLDHWAASQRLRQRDRLRMRRVEMCGPARAHQYRELSDLAEEIEAIDANASNRYDLEGLLEQFVETSRVHHRCVESLRYAPAGDAPFIERSRLRSDIQARRVRRREDTTTRIAELSDELSAMDEMLHLIAHSVQTTGSATDVRAELDRRLWELDEVDHAMAEITAEHSEAA